MRILKRYLQWKRKKDEKKLLKETILDTTILLISIFFIEIGFLYWWNLCFSISVLPTSIFVFSVFVYTFNFFYIFLLIHNFPLFLFKLKFKVKFTAYKLLLIYFVYYVLPFFFFFFSQANILQLFYSFIFTHSTNNRVIISIFNFKISILPRFIDMLLDHDINCIRMFEI